VYELCCPYVFSSCVISSKDERAASEERGASTCSVHSSGGHTDRVHVHDWWQRNRVGHGSVVQLYYARRFTTFVKV
jgi:hypothetical protein